jgi:hypothetical protein
MDYLSIPNWENLQHYKDRSPPWIKLHNTLLENYQFECLPDASKAHLICIWLLASRTNNKINPDPNWIKRRIGANSKVNIKLLIDEKFLVLKQEVQDMEQDASKMLALARSREQSRAEQSRAEQSRAEEPLSSKPDRTEPFDVNLIFDFWKKTFNHPQAKLDGKRRMNILNAFKMKFTEDELKTAIVGCSLTPHNMGQNDRNKPFYGLHVIFKSADQIERFIECAANPPKGYDNEKDKANSKPQRRNQSVADQVKQEIRQRNAETQTINGETVRNEYN